MGKMTIEETYKGMWSSDPSLLKSLLDAGKTIIRKHGIGLMPIFVTHLFGEPRYETYDSDWDSQYVDVKDFGSIEFLIPPRPFVLEPKPLEWVFQEKSEKNVDNFRCDQWPWHFYISEDGGYWAVYFEHDPLKSGSSDSVESAKAAIQEWRVNHLKSMLP